ncbi:MAG: hemolysin III family protein [Kiritimatiellia bacterium]
MEARPYTKAEEFANSFTHGVGAVLSIVALVLLSTWAASRGNPWLIGSCTVYGITLTLLYLASTLYHGVRSPRAKRILKVVDHASIFLLIAGTYTPFLLGPLRGPWGWTLFGLVWGIALGGIVMKLFWTGRFRLLSTLLYLAMGWIVVIAFKPLVHNLPMGGLLLLAAGGLLYTLGTVFYLWKQLLFGHAIWHAFVLAASACHFFSILLYVIPPVK